MSLTASVCVLGAVHAHAGASLSGRTLSQRDTIAATLIEASELSILAVYRQANPGAKADLWKIVGESKRVAHHPGALMMIGYTGGKEDIGKIETLLKKAAKRPYGYYLRKTAQAAINATAIMSRRGVPGATELLTRMRSAHFWKDKHSLFAHPTNLKKHPEERLWGLYYVAQGYCLSGEKDLEGVVRAMKAQAEGAAERDFVNKRITKAHLETMRKAIQKAEAGKPPKRLLGLIRALSVKMGGSTTKPANGAGSGVARTVKRDEENSITNDISDALSVYEDCVKAMKEKDYNYLALHLANNGRPWVRAVVPTKDQVKLAAKRLAALQGDIEKTLKLHKALKAAKVSYGNAIVRYRQEAIVEELGRGSGRFGDVRRESTVMITLSINGAESVLEGFGRVNKRGTSFDSKGRLQIVLLLKNRRWHWNPFCW